MLSRRRQEEALSALLMPYAMLPCLLLFSYYYAAADAGYYACPAIVYYLPYYCLPCHFAMIDVFRQRALMPFFRVEAVASYYAAAMLLSILFFARERARHAEDVPRY
jgi:hypothetical protein